jgi:hypothetical protein
VSFAAHITRHRSDLALQVASAVSDTASPAGGEPYTSSCQFLTFWWAGPGSLCRRLRSAVDRASGERSDDLALEYDKHQKYRAMAITLPAASYWVVKSLI